MKWEHPFYGGISFVKTTNWQYFSLICSSILLKWIYYNKNFERKGWNYRFPKTYFSRFWNSLISSFSIKWQALTQNQTEVIISNQTDVYMWENGFQVDFSLGYKKHFSLKIFRISIVKANHKSLLLNLESSTKRI